MILKYLRIYFFFIRSFLDIVQSDYDLDLRRSREEEFIDRAFGERREDRNGGSRRVFYPCNNLGLMPICIYCGEKIPREVRKREKYFPLPSPFVLHAALHFRLAINTRSEGRTEGETTAESNSINFQG